MTTKFWGLLSDPLKGLTRSRFALLIVPILISRILVHIWYKAGDAGDKSLSALLLVFAFYSSSFLIGFYLGAKRIVDAFGIKVSAALTASALVEITGVHEKTQFLLPILYLFLMIWPSARHFSRGD